VVSTTGQVGDGVYATAFDKIWRLVLAKNGSVTPEDIIAAKTFFTPLSSDHFPKLVSLSVWQKLSRVPRRR
jgi:hypothetical protein